MAKTTEPLVDSTHRYVAQKAIAVCAAILARNCGNEKFTCEELIAKACSYFNISGSPLQEVFEMSDGYVENPAFFAR